MSTRRMDRWVPLAVLIASVAACGDDDEGDEIFDVDPQPVTSQDNNPFSDIDSDTPPPAEVAVSASIDGFSGVRLVAETPTLQTTVPGTLVAQAPVLRAEDENGAPVPGLTVEFEAIEGGEVMDTMAVTDADGRAVQTGWRSGPSIGFYAMDAIVAGTVLRFAVEATSSYAIQLDFRSAVPPAIREAFQQAAARWSGVVRSELDDIPINTQELPEDCGQTSSSNVVDVDDLLIVVEVPDIDGVGGVLGQAGPCIVRTADDSPLVGSMEFDLADLEGLLEIGRLEEVVLHEMGHVIGIGTLWADLIENPSVNNAGADTRFLGSAATLAFQDLGGSGDSVPVENDGQPGSSDGHWREGVFRNELMSPRFTGRERSLPLSTVTVASLQDLDLYSVNVEGADPFELPESEILSLELDEPGDAASDHLLIRPSYAMDANGVITPLRSND
ncbi:MAG: leishmanolysin-related zinc metalloendopeptidase [Myxococcota bacterium]